MTFRECANLLQLSISDFAKDYRDQIVQVDSSGSSIFVSGGLNVWLQFNIEDQLIGYRVESVKGFDDNHVDLKIPGLRRF